MTAYFNDMLGTSLAAVGNGNAEVFSLTAFGDTIPGNAKSGESARSPLPVPQLDRQSICGGGSPFYTGKPDVPGLGHAFLFRNYRASLGKWQTSDPIGYPDGWNQLAYCGNGVASAVDLWGCLTVNVWDSSEDGWGHASITLDDGTYISWWPESKDEEFTSSLLYRRKTKDEDVWRLFHRVYRSVAPMAGSFIRAMDARHWPPVDYAKLLGPFPEWPKNRGDLRYEEGDGVIKLMNVAPYRPVKHFSVALALYAGNGDDYDIVFKINKKLEDRWSVAGNGSLSVVLDAESQEYHAHNEVSNGVSVKWTDLASEHVDGCAGNGYSNCARHRVTVRYDSYYADFYFERAVIN